MTDWQTVFDWKTMNAKFRVQVYDIPGSAHTSVRIQRMKFRELDPDVDSKYSRIPSENREWETEFHSEASHPIEVNGE